MAKTTTIRLSFHSVFGPLMEKYIQEKRAMGHRYNSSTLHYLEDFDRRIVAEGIKELNLPRDLIESWCAKRSTESRGTSEVRRSLARQFCLFLCRQGISVHIPINHDRSTRRSPFVARIFTHEEVGKILSLADSLPSTGLTPKRHLIMPEIFRILCCCGLRISEVIRLRVKDVDLDRGVLIIRDTKFGKDRLAPLADSMTDRLRAYASKMGVRNGEDFFFPSPYGGRYSKSTIYTHFREMLWKMNISHQGRGRGPRLHDLRHTFAVHRMAQWIHEGADLNVKLPILATYMGHHKLAGTQKYLQLTADMFPDITAMFEKRFGYVFPGRSGR